MDELLRRWRVVPEGPPRRTPTSVLVLGRRDGRPVVVKAALEEEERRGGRLLARWSGRGAVPVLERSGDVLLLERLTGPRDLAAMSRSGEDDAATAVLAGIARRLHASGAPTDGLLPLAEWFEALTGADHADPLLRACAATARRVLAATTPADVVALHGDLHHGNVLDAGREWLAIDPKGLVGHRAFDVANPLVNPDERAAGLLPGRLPIVARVAGLDVAVVRDWTIAWCGLSIVWHGGVPSWHARSCRAVAATLLG